MSQFGFYLAVGIYNVYNRGDYMDRYFYGGIE